METVELPPFTTDQLKFWAPSRPKVLFLDIDETMIHCLDERDPSTMIGKHTLEVETEPPIQIKVNMRPGLIESLKELS